MFLKRYVSTLIILLAFLGVVYEYQTHIPRPNQEIILQFKDVNVTSNSVQKALEVIKQQLEEVGVFNTRVKRGGHGELKIVYFSDKDISIIKDVFINKSLLNLDFTANNKNKELSKLPLNENLIAYSFNVYEIKKSDSNPSGFDGKYLIESNSETDRLLEPNSYKCLEFSSARKEIYLANIALKTNKNTFFLIGEQLCKIPEVRAGPSC